VQRLMKASGLSYTMHSAGTTVGMELLHTAPSNVSPMLHF
jgi:hypothetical protein